MFTSYNKANIILVSHILMLLHLRKSWYSKWAKYEKLEKYWSYCTRNRAIINAYLILEKEIFHTQMYSGSYGHLFESKCQNVSSK